MFFYISLFVASIIAAFVALYLFNLLIDASRAIQKSWLPSAKSNPTRHVGGMRYGTAPDTSTPWMERQNCGFLLAFFMYFRHFSLFFASNQNIHLWKQV